MSALGDQIKLMLAKGGAITVERFMELALADPQYGYYMTRDPFGTEGDFTTAPEISQMFGELIGLWAAEVWTSMGRPNPVRADRAWPRPRHADERRLARRARRPRIPRRARRHADRDEPAARPDPIRRAAHRRRADRLEAAASPRRRTVRRSFSPTSSSTRCRSGSSSDAAGNGASGWCGSTARASLPSASPTSRSRISARRPTTAR